MAWINAVLKRGKIIAEEKFAFGSLEIREKERAVFIDGNEIVLRPKEFDLLDYFAHNNHVVLSREQLLKTVWEYDYYGDLRTVDTHIKSLRERLGGWRNLITTVWGIGYKFEYKE